MTIIFDLKDSFYALLGGSLIGLAATLILLFKGRVAGVSGIFNGMFFLKNKERAWRSFFIFGLILGGLVSSYFYNEAFENTFNFSNYRMAIAGVLVGFGTFIGTGCTSGHGVCGISRFSKRSICATLTFMAFGVLTVFILKVLNI